jgi:hypothetical protein
VIHVKMAAADALNTAQTLAVKELESRRKLMP